MKGLFQSFRARIFILVAILMTTSMSVISVFLLSDLKDTMVEAFRERGLLLAREFSQKVTEGILIEDKATLNKFISQLCDSQDVLYVFIYNKSGLSLAKKTTIDGIKDELPSSTHFAAMEVEAIAPHGRIHNAMLDITAPVRYENELIGFIRLGISLERVNDQVNRRMLKSSILVAVFIMIGLVVSFGFSRSFSQPISQLLDGVRKTGEGDLSHHVFIPNKDEIGELAAAFNKMIDDLRSKTTSIDNLVEAEKEVSRARQKAEVANAAKGMFLAKMSHEIRTPLHGIIGSAEIMLHAESLASCHDHSRIILEESEHLLRLINRLLDHSKIEAGKLQLEHEPFDLLKLLDNVLNITRVPAERKGLLIKKSILPGVARCYLGDSLRLSQILINLVNNAIKFTEQGSVTIQVEPVDNDVNVSTLRFAVIDTGIGIPKEKQASVFESFTQADQSTTRQYGGTGLGTTISDQLVRLMGGKMGLESEQGKGSTFWFTLPLERSESLDVLESLSLSSLANGSRGDYRPQRSGHILVAEDYPVNQRIAREHLEGRGYTVTIVDDGEKAVKACESAKYDLILMDVQMPNMDGYEAAALIRSGPSLCTDVPILAVTANVDAETHQACKHAKMNDILTKPIRRKSLIAAVDSWVPAKTQEADTADESASAVIVTAQGDIATVEQVGNEDNHMRDETSADSVAPEKSVPIDYDVIMDEFDDMFIVDCIVNAFIEDAEIQLQNMKEDLARNNIDALRRDAHTIRGGAASLEAKPLEMAAEQFGFFCKTGEFDSIPGAFDNLRREFDALKEFVEKHHAADD